MHIFIDKGVGRFRALGYFDSWPLEVTITGSEPDQGMLPQQTLRNVTVDDLLDLQYLIGRAIEEARRMENQMGSS